MITSLQVHRRRIPDARPASLAVYFALILAAVAPVCSEAQAMPEDGALALQTLEDFHSAEQAAARKPLSEVDESYRSKLTKYQKTSQEAGNLNAVLAAKQALDDLDAGKPASISSDAEVAKIQNAYTLERRKADAAYAKALAKVEQDYLASLQKLVTDLTKGGQIDQAVEVQTKVNQLKVSLSQNSAENPTAGSSGFEEWKKKALKEFPELSDPASPLSLRVQALREMKKSTPSYFSNPQWPLLLAKEAHLKEEEAGERELKKLLTSAPWAWHVGPPETPDFGSARFLEGGKITGISWITDWEVISGSSFKVFHKNKSVGYWVFKLAKNRKYAETDGSGTIKDKDHKSLTIVGE